MIANEIRALIEDLGKPFDAIKAGRDRKKEAAAALATLQAENISLRAEVERLKGPQHWDPIYNTDPVPRACGELPEGIEVEILLERGAGCVYLVDNNCGERISFDNEDKFDWTIHSAIDEALSRSKDGA